MRSRIAILLAVVLAVTAQPAAAGQAGTVGGSSQGQSGRTYQVTLITGDVVVLHVAGGGKQAAWVERQATRGRPARVYQQDGEVHVVPDQAAPYVASGVLDEKLFNVSLLVEQGYHDAATKTLPLLVQGPAPSRAATPVRELRTIGARSVAVGKNQIPMFWASVKGVARTKVWLNVKIRATLDRSVPQVGAPKAWAAGYDGRGVRVAVLDTGYDPTHPDLAGRVIQARNFTPAASAVDRHGHGTHVAATVAGNGGRKGVAPRADLLVGKVLDDNGEGTMDEIIAGMEWAAGQGARVVNMSVGTPWSSDGTDPMSQTVDRLTSATGTLFVVAAGNSGPDEQTIGAPGAATSALTVGAVTKSDAPAGFSSRGPRPGDLAVKPEIVAPGAGIVAARAAGTTQGSVLDARYTSMNGTSMAAPHVAGAAAILAQQHPEWKADQLKARLVSSSRNLRDQPVTFQGAGRLDVAAAVDRSSAVDVAALSLGRLERDVTRSLTYRNPTPRPVLLRLSNEVESTGSRPYRPSMTLSRSLLLIPPRGQATVQVSVSPRRTRTGAYAGIIAAQNLLDRDDRLSTVVSFTVGGPLRTVTVRGVDRNGQPAQGPVDLWSHDTGESVRVFMREGVAAFQVPDGRYTMVATLETWSGEEWPPLSETVAGDPELTVHSDTTIRYDAREGRAVNVRTARETQLESYDVMWHRSVGRRSYVSQAAQGVFGQELFLVPSGPARQGVFEFATQWQLPQPLLRASINGSRIGPIAFASAPYPFVGSARLPAVYAGAGQAEDFAGVDVRGKIAVVSRHGEFGELDAQAERARAAGAVLLLAHNDRTGPWVESTFQTVLPTYTIDQATGAKLKGQTVDVVGQRDSSYVYELAYTDSGRIPPGRTRHADAGPLATVESDYRENSERLRRREWWIPYVGSAAFGNGMSSGRNGPVRRTEYVSTENAVWQRFGQPHEFAGLYWTWSAPAPLRPGERYRQTWWGPLVGPAVPPITGAEEVGSPVARFRDAIRVLIPHYSYGGTLRGTIFEQMGDRSELTLRRDGQLVGRADWPEAQFTVPAGSANYELRLEVTNGPGNWSDTSVHTESSWRFRSARPSEARAVLPLVQVGYELATGPRNEIAAGTPYPLVVRPGYQPGVRGPGGFTVAVEISYDDGTSWRRVPVDGGRAMIPAATGPGFGSVRVTATDAAGNSLTQRIDRAWRIEETE